VTRMRARELTSDAIGHEVRLEVQEPFTLAEAKRTPVVGVVETVLLERRSVAVSFVGLRPAVRSSMPGEQPGILDGFFVVGANEWIVLDPFDQPVAAS
jgi:hypothetical protein